MVEAGEEAEEEEGAELGVEVGEEAEAAGEELSLGSIEVEKIGHKMTYRRSSKTIAQIYGAQTSAARRCFMALENGTFILPPVNLTIVNQISPDGPNCPDARWHGQGCVACWKHHQFGPNYWWYVFYLHQMIQYTSAPLHFPNALLF